MATIALVAGGLIGLIYGLITYALGQNPAVALIVWLSSGNVVSLAIYATLRKGAGMMSERLRMASVYDDVLALDEAETRRAMLAASDGSSMSRLLRVYAERDSRAASTRANRRMDP